MGKAMNLMKDVTRRRLVAVGVLALVALGAVSFRLVSVAVVNQERWLGIAEQQQQRTVTLDPERGSLLDRDGRPLAVSMPAWSAWADPSAFKDEDHRRDAARRLAGVLATAESEIAKRLAKDRYFVWLERKLDPEHRDQVEALKIRGVGFVKESRRLYPQDSLAAHVLGTVGTDNSGLEGLEARLNSRVAGKPGKLLTMRDARGSRFLPEGLSHQPPTRGADVTLSIDSVIQYYAERELREAVDQSGATAGSIVVMFPDSGDMAALTNYPTFNPNNFPTYPSHLRTNRAVASCYEPGSTFKIFTAAAALDSGSVQPDDIIDCGRGVLRFGRVRIHDHHSFDQLSVEDVLVKSSNVGAARLAMATGAERLHEALSDFGFGRRTGLNFPGESAGILHSASSWSGRSLATVAFGQEVAVSPVQLVAAASAIANGGILHRPRLVLSDENGQTIDEPSSRRVVSEQTARTLSRFLEGVVSRGTARKAQVEGYRIAGKTGTAQKIGPDGKYADDKYIASFVGWAPARSPAFVALVTLDEPKGARYHGGDVAAPAFANLARDVLRHLKVPPRLAETSEELAHDS